MSDECENGNHDWQHYRVLEIDALISKIEKEETQSKKSIPDYSPDHLEISTNISDKATKEIKVLEDERYKLTHGGFYA